MTISDEAVETAAKAVESAVEDDTCPDDYDSTDNGTCLHCVRLMLLAAVPHIEAAIRAKVAAEIEKLYAYEGDREDAEFNNGVRFAASVARGGSR